jgi:Subtilase family
VTQGEAHVSRQWQQQPHIHIMTVLVVSLGVSWGADAFPIGQPSITDDGIDALKLHQQPYNLTGRKIAIGQVEIGRPGQFGIDKAISKNRLVAPVQVFFRNQPAKGNANLDGHATQVASVIISTGKAMRGVAPDARLYSSAAGTPFKSGQTEECLSAQHVALQNGGDVRAINFSFGESLRQDPRPNPVLDGNALLTQCLDWSARVHDVVYTVAGNQGKGGIPIPTDNFNGMTVAFTSRINGIYSKVDFSNIGDSAPSILKRNAGVEMNLGGRRGIALTAPGSKISLVALDGNITTSSGSSFASPHVVGTVALLQEYGDRQLRQVCRRNVGCALPWTPDARRHEVMKAVLMNAAEKIKDQGDGLTLGMTRTIVEKNNQTWFDSDVAQNPNVPLNIQMGSGQLNAYRAYQQFSPGQWPASAPVPVIGWDYGQVGQTPAARLKGNLPKGTATDQPTSSIATSNPTPSFQEYQLQQPLQPGSFISATLAWDRRVELIDRNNNGEYDQDERFRDRGLNQLRLYLMRAEDTDIRQAVWSSISDIDSVQHIFHKIPKPGRYKLRVQFHRQVNEPIQPYALAWWTVPVSPKP